MRVNTNHRSCVLINPATPLGLGYISEHLGLGYLAARLAQDGWHSEIVDAYLDRVTLDETVQCLEGLSRPCFVGITVISARAWQATRKLIGRIRDLWPGIRIVLGGYYATFWHNWILTQCPEGTIVVRGEGEETLSDLTQHLWQGTPYHSTLGISFRSGGRIQVNEARPLISNLNILPFPTRPTLQTVITRGGFPSIYGSRGCYFVCSFCQVCQFYRSQPGSVYRARSIDNVLDEVEALIAATSEGYIGFVDDEFVGAGTKGMERTWTFCRAIEQRGLVFQYGIQCRADSVDRELFARLKETGLGHVYLGIESAVQRSLDLFEKRVTVDDNLRAVRTLEDLGIDYTMGFILCDPYTTLDELKQNVAFIQQVAAFPLGLNGLNVLRGTPLETRFDSEGLLKRLDGDLDVHSVHPALQVFRRQLRSYASIYIPVLNRLRQLAGWNLAHSATAGGSSHFVSREYEKVKALHLAFLEETIAALEHNGTRTVQDIIEQMETEYTLLDAEVDQHLNSLGRQEVET
jgi:anaerobic magnesium-protoporphyrin IX monomethyl ester cyclase